MKKLRVISFILISVGLTIIIFILLSNFIYKEICTSQINEFNRLKNSVINDADKNENRHSEDNDDNNGEVQQAANNTTVLYKVDLDRLYADSVDYNKNLISHQREFLKDTSYEVPALNLKDYGIPNNMYGYLSAPTIDTELPIYLGASEQNMSYGATHMTYTSLPIGGKGNCVISAHSGYIGKLFFDNIVNLSVGDQVSVTNFWNTLIYEVKDFKILKDYQSADCYIKDGKDMLTLITCISDGEGGFNRFYVICERYK